ncbi:hypothetical protein H8A97_43170, partial [Bradyrhizobium sp. Arg62]|uniref:hypothetical protein n=1 Tax=Bradyrhizobium brasilense TaxID=1419277 RepID=UPI001E32075F
PAMAELAAMAAAAIASGAAGWSDGAVAAGVGAVAGVAATGAITAFTVAAPGSCCAVACVASGLSLVDFASELDVESSDFDFDLVLDGASLSTLLSSRELAESRDVRSEPVLVSRERASVVEGGSSDRREGAGWES